MDSQTVKQMLDFIELSPSRYHVVAGMKKELREAGYSELFESDRWKLCAGGKYFVVRNDSAILAFQIPKTDFRGFMIMASHSDSPAFKIKENPEILVEAAYTKLNVEKYGGALLAQWLDRPLSVAGRIFVKMKEGIETRLVNIDRDLVLIPSLAIHMNRDVNKGYEYHVQKDLLPLFGDADAGTLRDMIAVAAGTDRERIIGEDLFLYNRCKASLWGAGQEYLSAPRLDDVQCAFASLTGFLRAVPADSIPVLAVFDNEEVGSSTRQGASSTFLKDTLLRINAALGRNMEDYFCAISESFMISADNAHAFHPNYTDKADPVNHPVMNGGIVIKYSADQKYTTDGVSAAVCKILCEKADIPYQIFVNHSDLPGGSTLGSLSGNQVAVSTADVGIAQLAMHSPYETCGVKDTEYMVRLAQELFSSSVCQDGNERYRII